MGKAIDFSSPLRYVVLISILKDLISLHEEEVFLGVFNRGFLQLLHHRI